MDTCREAQRVCLRTQTHAYTPRLHRLLTGSYHDVSSLSFEGDDEPIIQTCHRGRNRHTRAENTHTRSCIILHPCESQRVLFCDPLEFIPSLLLPPAFDLNQRRCDLTVMNAEIYHTAQSERVCNA